MVILHIPAQRIPTKFPLFASRECIAPTAIHTSRPRSPMGFNQIVLMRYKPLTQFSPDQTLSSMVASQVRSRNRGRGLGGEAELVIQIAKLRVVRRDDHQDTFLS